MQTRLKRHRFHQFVVTFLSALFGPLLKKLYSFRTDKKVLLDGPYLVIANHVTAADPVLICLSFRKQMYTVADAHLMQKGFGSAVLQICCDPIVRRKGDSAVSAVKEMLQCLKAGFNVCVFPEGTCSFDGTNSPMLPTIGKLAKTAGVTLITYRFEGGFFTLPRWGRGIRRGDYYGHVAGIYSPEELRSMSAAEINDRILEDLSEDAYKRQVESPVQYRGRHLAEHLETAYFLCPQCKRVGTLTTSGSSIKCSCGLSGTLDPEYRLHDMPVAILPEWDRLQTEWLKDSVLSPGFRFSDDYAVLIRTEANHRRRKICEGSLSMDRSELKIGDISFPLPEIQGMEIVRKNLLVFSTASAYYQITGAETLCTRKYFQLYLALKGALS